MPFFWFCFAKQFFFIIMFFMLGCNGFIFLINILLKFFPFPVLIWQISSSIHINKKSWRSSIIFKSVKDSETNKFDSDSVAQSLTYSKCSTYKYVANLLIKGHWIFFNVQETPEFRIWIWPVKALGWPCSGLCTCLQHDLFFLKMVRTQMCTAKTKTEYP